jgi:lactoylglutathione lyase
MKIHHVSLYVHDLEVMHKFYEKYFCAKANGLYFNPTTGYKSYRLSFEDGNKIEIMAKPGLKDFDKDINYFGYNHIALSVGGRDMVDKITNQLEKDGCKIISYPHIAGDGCYESAVMDPENNLIEIDE